jgi:alkanesulfonate monooxygenase
MSKAWADALDVFSTCPPSAGFDQATYLDHVIKISRWSEHFGCKGILVYTDNSLVGPWLLSQMIVLNTERLSPLVAIQPIYTLPYTAAKKIATIAHLHGRRLYVNMLAGGFKNDLIALGDDTPHDDRYVRMVEFTTIMRDLCNSPDPVTFEGKYYNVKGLRLTPPVPDHLKPGILSSGSSEAGMDAARAVGSIAIKYPKAPGEEESVHGSDIETGVRIGIIARKTASEAWRIALERFPEDRRGQITHDMAMKVSDSEWHKQLSGKAEEAGAERSPYWLGPFQNYKTFCPYLVGDYDQVSELLGRYVDLGHKTFIIDVPHSEEDLQHIDQVFDLAVTEFA